MNQPNPPTKTEERIQKLKVSPRLWVWFLGAASAVILSERLLVWVMAQFNSLPKGFGLDIPTMLSIAGILWGIAVWLYRKIQGVLGVVEGLNTRVAQAEVGIRELQAQVDALQETQTEHRAKLDYHELRIDYNDAKIKGIELELRDQR